MSVPPPGADRRPPISARTRRFPRARLLIAVVVAGVVTLAVLSLGASHVVASHASAPDPCRDKLEAALGGTSGVDKLLIEHALSTMAPGQCANLSTDDLQKQLTQLLHSEGVDGSDPTATEQGILQQLN